ncbi:MAG: HNH endonuclease [Nitrosopumilus sp.]|nr:HNH endonuclease [Nitrosopumilus sp.]
MIKKNPHFIIKNNSQKGGYRYSDILTSEILQDVCRQVTGCTEYTCNFDDDGYNKGRLARIEYLGRIIYVSFSQDGKIASRNSFFQSVTTALTQYYFDEKRKKFCFYFLPSEGNVETPYFMFMYRLMATSGIEFLNPDKLEQSISPFNTVDDIIATRDKLKRHNKSNNSTYITRSSEKITEIYGKTYGASKKETTLICLAISTLVSHAKLYEICEQELCTLPEPDLNAIKSRGNMEVISTNMTMEKKYLDDNSSLRSPRFNYNLLEKMGSKKCAFCKCEIPELIEGAHIWPVSNIKQKPNLTLEEKIKHATDGDNGIWLCQNHHKMLDNNLLRIVKNGEVKYLSDLDERSVEFIKESTPITKIKKEIIVKNFVKYLGKRNKLFSETNYVSL